MWGIKQANSFVNEVECADHGRRKIISNGFFWGEKGNTQLNIM
jgi:hypothetical protein